METGPLSQPAAHAAPSAAPAVLPSEPELRAFAHAAAARWLDDSAQGPLARAFSRRPGPGLQHLDHRDYLPGDDVRHIDWRVTARSARPVVRRFEAENGSNWTLLLDASASMGLAGGRKFDAARRWAAATAYMLLHLGNRVGLMAYADGLRARCAAGQGQRQYARLAQTLTALTARAPGGRSDLAACVGHLGESASCMVLSDGLPGEAMLRSLSTLRMACTRVHLVLVNDAQETCWPGGEVLALVDVETGERLLVHGDAHPGEAAAAERLAGIRRLDMRCRQLGVVFSHWPTDQPWQGALLRHWQRARARR